MYVEYLEMCGVFIAHVCGCAAVTLPSHFGAPHHVTDIHPTKK